MILSAWGGTRVQRSLALVLAALSWITFFPSTNAPQSMAAGYGNGSNHIWDQVFDQFYLRATPDGAHYGGDDLDPPLWPDTNYFLADPARQQTLSTLGKFLATHAEKLIPDPLKRAVFQHDLWPIFDWPDERYAPAESNPWRKELANVMSRVSLSPAEIQALPDTYVQAIASKAFPKQYDENRRERGFLPPDLFQSDGPWVCLGRVGGLAASIHANGRSVFLVFLHLPEGRDATLAYLNELRNFPEPTIANHDEDYMVLRNAGGAMPFVPNPSLPEFPPGTEVALVRQMLVINEQGVLTPTRIVESVQIRVYRAVPSRDGWRAGTFRDFHDVFEFRLSRQKLFSGEAGGLREVTAADKGYPQPMSISMPIDWVEMKVAPQPILRSCAGCHDAPGIHSLLTYSRGPWPLGDGSYLPRLYPSSPRDEEQGTIEWKQQQGSWRRLATSWGSRH
jgi:hypothetical protein